MPNSTHGTCTLSFFDLYTFISLTYTLSFPWAFTLGLKCNCQLETFKRSNEWLYTPRVALHTSALPCALMLCLVPLRTSALPCALMLLMLCLVPLCTSALPV